jgi:hypothetical protein
MNNGDDADIDAAALEKFCDEHPMHSPPEELLLDIFEYLPEDDPCLIDAARLLEKWEDNGTPLEMRKAEADFFFLKWDFVGAPQHCM